jgi:hypothetical protein
MATTSPSVLFPSQHRAHLSQSHLSTRNSHCRPSYTVSSSSTRSAVFTSRPSGESCQGTLHTRSGGSCAKPAFSSRKPRAGGAKLWMTKATKPAHHNKLTSLSTSHQNTPWAHHHLSLPLLTTTPCLSEQDIYLILSIDARCCKVCSIRTSHHHRCRVSS